MMSSHTPGPWKVDEMCCYIWGKDNGEPFTVAEIRGWGQLAQQHKETEAIAIQEANARLIAAAPELKENLRNVVVAAKVLREALVLVQGWANLPFGPFGTDKIIKKAEDLLRKAEGEEETE